MKRKILHVTLLILAVICCAFISKPVQAQNHGKRMSVMIEAEVQKNPASIKLTWQGSDNADGWSVYRKLNDGNEWNNKLTDKTADDTTYTDNNVNVGTHYEYLVLKRQGGNSIGAGYINSGIEVQARHFRGRVALLVDSRFKDTLSSEIERLKFDLQGSGWSVNTLYIDTGNSVPAVKDSIRQIRQEYPNEMEAVFLLGEIPVPYAGNFVSSSIQSPPDGHQDHGGAWPADLYYGEFDGLWSDNQVNNTSSKFARNHNVPNDNKWDQTVLQQVNSTVDLMVGRVDMSDLPAFNASEIELIKRYLDKNNRYRHGKVNIKHQGVIEGNFNLQEGFPQSAYRSFPALMGIENTIEGDYSNSLTNDSFLWSFGAGDGSMTSAEGILNTNQFASGNFNGVFTMLFGSYFGDYDGDNNLLRAALASKGNLLSVSWSGRPHWHYHPIGMGASLGYCARLTQNNAQIGNRNVLYNQGAFGGGNHVALLGDPTLTMYQFEPPRNIDYQVVNNKSAVKLTWQQSAANVDGYEVYRWSKGLEKFLRITKSPVTGTSFTDNKPNNDTLTYMVRAVRLETTPSGSFYNLSQGIFDTAYGVSGSTGIAQVQSHNISIYPNPTHGPLNVKREGNASAKAVELNVTNLHGQVLKTVKIDAGERDKTIRLGDQEPGVYFLRWQTTKGVQTKKVVVQ